MIELDLISLLIGVAVGILLTIARDKLKNTEEDE